jgi:hypothetical protein
MSKNAEIKDAINQANAAGANPNSPDPTDPTDWTSDDVPCFAVGEGRDKKGNPRVKKITGLYLYSIVRRIKRRDTILHRFASAIVDGEKVQGECLVYGSGSVNHKMRNIPERTKIRFTYLGEIDTGQDSPMKNILVEWPRGTRLEAKATGPRRDTDFPAEDDVPF